MRNQSTHLDFARPGNRDDVLALCEEPRERDLPRRRVVLGSDALDGVDEREDGGEVFFGESMCGR